MKAMIDNGADVEAIVAQHFTTPAVVRQRLKLAAVSARLHDIYADDGMTLDQLMAFTVAVTFTRFQPMTSLAIRHSSPRLRTAIGG